MNDLWSRWRGAVRWCMKGTFRELAIQGTTMTQRLDPGRFVAGGTA